MEKPSRSFSLKEETEGEVPRVSGGAAVGLTFHDARRPCGPANRPLRVLAVVVFFCILHFAFVDWIVSPPPHVVRGRGINVVFFGAKPSALNPGFNKDVVYNPPAHTT